MDSPELTHTYKVAFTASRDKVSGCTEVGPRSNNEDSMQHKEIKEFHILAISDGVGGSPYGEVASETSTSTFIEAATELLLQKIHPHRALIEGVRIANERVCEKQAASPDTHGDMCCTFIGAIIEDDRVHLAHIGDSRAYIVNRDKGARQITTDHNLFEEWKKGDMEYYGELCGETLCCVIGDEFITLDYHDIVLDPKDMLVLCTDGVSNVMSTEEIGKVVLTPNIDKNIAEFLVNKAKERGLVDNTTALVYRS